NELVEEAPRPDQGEFPVGQGAAHRHRSDPAEGHGAGLDDREFRPAAVARGTSVFAGVGVEVRHIVSLVVLSMEVGCAAAATAHIHFTPPGSYSLIRKRIIRPSRSVGRLLP